jgi:hypothetical protein
MSIQRDLTDYGTEPEAADRDAEDETTTAWTPTDDDVSPTQCQRCEAHVSAEYRRCRGDDDGRVYGCPNCYSTADLKNGAAREGSDGERSYTRGGPW